MADDRGGPSAAPEPASPAALEPEGPKSTAELPAYVDALVKWIMAASDVDLDLHQKRNKKWLDYIRANREKDQQRIDLALDARSLK